MAMTVQQMAERIVRFVRLRDHVSFPELLAECGPEAIGDLSLELKRNLVVWLGVSELFSDALTTALSHVQPVIVPTLIYHIDCKLVTFPVAKRIREYQKPHWLPVIFRPIEKLTRRTQKAKKSSRLV